MSEDEYEVSGDDTLTSIAAKLDTVPSVLAQHNKLTSRYVYPGMKLKVPPKKPEEPPEPAPALLPEEPEMIDPQFVRVNVRHVTDGRGVVRGALLVTPKVLMFNPSPNDPLVREADDPDRFQLVSPVELVVNAAVLREFVKYRPGRDDLDEAVVFRDDDGDGSEPSGLEDDEVETPLYLRLLMGKPIAKKLPRTAPIISYGEQNLEAQYWFIVSPSRSRRLYAFMKRNFEPHKYGRLNVEDVERTGYELIREGAAVVEAEAGRTCNRETVGRSAQMMKHLTLGSLDLTDISEMIGESELVDVDQRVLLARCMPPRTDGHDWVLKFSTSHHGFTLNSLVRKLAGVSGPVLMLVGDVAGAKFGAFLSSAPNTFSEHFRGTGETFVFTLTPEFKKYSWTGENNFFYRVNSESLIVGSGDGNFALWIDADLNQGRTLPCSTFDSVPLTTEDFTLKTLECWAFEM